MIARICSLFAALSLLAACSHSDHTPVPRSVAYPRVPVYDSAYVAVPSLPLHLELSANAVTQVDSAHSGSMWINATYPAYNATLHLTLTPVTPATEAEVIANRTERMSLNSGVHPTEITQLTSPAGFRSQVLFTPAGSVTPVQILSVSPRWVISGALYHPQADSSPDSIAPVLRAVRRDLIHTAKTIR